MTKAASCTKAGVRTYTCTVCGDSFTEAIPALGHRYVNGVCTVCGAADPTKPDPVDPVDPVEPSGSGEIVLPVLDL